MSKQRTIPPIHEYMSTSPVTIEAHRSMAHAHAIMADAQIRHLPVVSGQKLVGIITERDLHTIEALSNVDPTRIRVDTVMIRQVYAVAPETPIDEVVREMARNKYGSAVVVDGNRVVGVLTVVDVCRALAEVLQAD